VTGSDAYNYLTIYRQAERDEFIDSARQSAPFFDRVTRAWIVVDPELCRELLSSPALYPAPALEHYRNMPSGFGDQFVSVAFAFEHIPLAMYGERHTEARRQASTFIAGRHNAIHAWVENELPRHLLPFAQPGRVELMGEVIKPLVRGLFATLVDIDLPDHLALDRVSQVFDKSIGMSRRIRLEEDMARLEAHLREQLRDMSEDDLGMRLGLLVIGKDALVGTLAESLYQLFRDNAGVSLERIEFPRMPHQTAVPFVERIASAPLSVAGLDLAEGDRVRIVLQTYGHSPSSEHHRYFGAGAHACLGRPLSLELWSTIAARLSKLTSRVRVLDYRLAPDSYVFNVPTTFEVEVTS
jgi:cytochrome P450